MAWLTTIALSLVLPTVPKLYQASATASEQKQEFNVQKFDSNGKFLFGWGTRGSGNDQFYHAHGIAIDSSGNVYISDQGNYHSTKSHSDAIPHISKFTSDGKFITKW